MMQTVTFVGRDNAVLLQRGEALRRAIWRGEAEVVTDELLRALDIDDLDRDATHVACLDGDDLVAIAQISVHTSLDRVRDRHHYEPFVRADDFPLAMLNRLVVRPSHRGHGLARQADIERLKLAAAAGVRTVYVEAQGQRIQALQELGFAVCGSSADLRYPGSWSIMRRSMENPPTDGAVRNP